MKFLILTSYDESIFADNMHSFLERKNHEVVRLNLSNLFISGDDFTVPFVLSIDNFTFFYKKRSYQLSDFDIVWKRRFDGNFLNRVLNHSAYKNFPDSVWIYLEREVHALQQTILSYLRVREIRLINDFDLSINNKVNQLTKAKDVGLNIPEFIFSNRKNAFESFLKLNNEVITKPCSNFGYIHDSNHVFTHKTSKLCFDDLINLPKTSFPSFLQKAVKHSFELKCIYVGGKMFAVKQQHIEESSDCDIKLEYSNSNVTLTSYDINEVITSRTKQLCDYFKIDLCTIDFLVDQDGKYTFLEINPDGIIAFYSNYIFSNIYQQFYTFLIDEKKVH